MILFKIEHVPMILSGEKTQTRRIWKRCRAKVGGLHWAQTRLFDPASRFARLEILGVSTEPLGFISEEDAFAEGYASPLGFLEAFERINGRVARSTVVHVVQFKLLEAL